MKALQMARGGARHGARGIILAAVFSVTAHAALLAGFFVYVPASPLGGGLGGLGVEISLAGLPPGIANGVPDATGAGAGSPETDGPAPVEPAAPEALESEQAEAEAPADDAVAVALLKEEPKPQTIEQPPAAQPKQAARAPKPERKTRPEPAKPQKSAPRDAASASGSGIPASPGERPGAPGDLPLGAPEGVLSGSPEGLVTGAGPGGGTGKPEPLGSAVNPKPRYPELARQRGQEGTVFLLAEVDAQGAPQSVVVQKSSGHTLLDSAALQTVQRWRFNPARLAGLAVAGRVLVPVQFSLHN